MKINVTTSCFKGMCIRIQQNVSINPFFCGNIVVIYELEDKMCCISKHQNDRDL